jgi:hypothetical protein
MAAFQADAFYHEKKKPLLARGPDGAFDSFLKIGRGLGVTSLPPSGDYHSSHVKSGNDEHARFRYYF